MSDKLTQSKVEEVIVNAPIALKQLIESKSELLRNYQEKLLVDIEIANQQIMDMVGLDPEDGWRLDLQNVVYRRPKTKEELALEDSDDLEFSKELKIED